MGAKNELEKFIGQGLNENASSFLNAAAYRLANEANAKASGLIEPSSVNVEDFIFIPLAELGITDADFLKGSLIRIDVSTHGLQKLNLRLPSGSEMGANNMFKFGGKTSGGLTEAVVDGIPLNGTGVTKTIIK